jgi:ankyrin repeat protein
MLMPDIEDDQEDCETIPLFLDIERGNQRAIERYLAQGGDAEARNEEGQTLLAAAALYSWPKIVRLLLEHSAGPNARDNAGRTPLHHAATHSIDSVKLLLAAGADATARDNQAKSVLGEWSYRADQILRVHGAVE